MISSNQSFGARSDKSSDSVVVPSAPPSLKPTDTYTCVSSLDGDHTQYNVTHEDGSKTVVIRKHVGPGGGWTFRTIPKAVTTPKCNLFGLEYNNTDSPIEAVPQDEFKVKLPFRIVRN